MKLVGRITILAFFAGVPTGWPFVHPTPRRAQSTKSGRTPGGQTWPPVPDSGAWPVFFRSSTHNSGLQASFSDVQKALSIVDVVQTYLPLTRVKQHEYSGRCPFHEDSTPSFGVNEEKGVYHCFGCKASGNVFDFVMEKEGLSFPDAVQKLADDYGIELGGDIVFGNHTRLHKALECAAEWYASMLVNERAGRARSHLRERKVMPSVATSFQIGYAPREPGALLTHMVQHDFSSDDLVGSGLFKPDMLSRHKGQALDRLAGRLIVPIRNARGQVIGFSGRALGDDPEAAKYVNSPDTPLFRKRSSLFGLDAAKAAIKEAGVAVVVEGYFDVIMLHAAGVENVVACMGTSLCLGHLYALRVVLPEDGTVVLAFDHDKAGVLSAEKACTGLLLGLDAQPKLAGLTVKIAQLPEGDPAKDPADFVVARGTDAARAYREEVMDKAVLWAEWFGTRLLARAQAGSVGEGDGLTDDLTGFTKAADPLTSFIAKLGNSKPAIATKLCEMLVRRALPGNSLLHDRLTKELLRQADIKLLRDNQLALANVSHQKGYGASVLPPPRASPTAAPAHSAPLVRPTYGAAATAPGARGGAVRAEPLPVDEGDQGEVIKPVPMGKAGPAAAQQKLQEEQRRREEEAGAAGLDMKRVVNAERWVLKHAIRDPAFRRALQQLVQGEELLLSSQAHQALFSWLVESGRVLPASSASQVRFLFERDMAQQFRGLLPYFEGVDRQPQLHHGERSRATPVAALSLMIKASIEQRNAAEKEFWRLRLERFRRGVLPSAGAKGGPARQAGKEPPQPQPRLRPSGSGYAARPMATPPPASRVRTGGFREQQPAPPPPPSQQQRGHAQPSPSRAKVFYTEGVSRRPRVQNGRAQQGGYQP